MTLAEDIIKRHGSLAAKRATWDTLWQRIGDYVMPRKAYVTEKVSQPDEQKETRLFDGTAVRANQILANGCLAHMTPHESRWFSYRAPENLRTDDEVEQWFARCTEIATEAIAASNFYTEIHEFYLDRSCFGTAALHVEGGRKGPLTFRALTCGDYSADEDDEKNVDTVYRCLKLTPRQAEMKFGRDKLGPKMKQALEKSDPCCDAEHEFLHAIYPRTKINLQKGDGANKPIASCYVDPAEKHLISEGGYDEMPTMVSRYLRWGNDVYGWSPGWMALPEAKQLNFLQMQMDALAEITAFPRVLAPVGLEGFIDLRASGVTYFDEANPNAVPREWATSGRYDVGAARVIEKQKAIDQAFHVDLFRMFAMLDKQMTAREVAERAGEKLIQFSPTFARLTTEMLNPLLQRIFGLLIRGGHFPPPPLQLLQRGPGGEAVLLPPKVAYLSRIALAIQELQNMSFIRTMELLTPAAQARPIILDNFAWDVIARDAARNAGLPAEWLRSTVDVDADRKAQAQALAQQQQLANMGAIADAAGKAGRVQPGTAAGRVLDQALPPQ